jgi:hypothetical protein
MYRNSRTPACGCGTAGERRTGGQGLHERLLRRVVQLADRPGRRPSPLLRFAGSGTMSTRGDRGARREAGD